MNRGGRPSLGDDGRQGRPRSLAVRKTGEQDAGLESDARARRILKDALPHDPFEQQRIVQLPSAGALGERTEDQESVALQHHLHARVEPEVHDHAGKQRVAPRGVLNRNRSQLELELVLFRDLGIGLVEWPIRQRGPRPEADDGGGEKWHPGTLHRPRLSAKTSRRPPSDHRRRPLRLRRQRRSGRRAGGPCPARPATRGAHGEDGHRRAVPAGDVQVPEPLGVAMMSTPRPAAATPTTLPSCATSRRRPFLFATHEEEAPLVVESDSPSALASVPPPRDLGVT